VASQRNPALALTAKTRVGHLMKRGQALLLEMITPLLRERGLTMVQYQIMAWLREGIVRNPRDFSSQYRQDGGAVSRVIDKLATRGYLNRARRDRDRRKVELQLTPAGLAEIEILIPLVVKKLNLAFTGFSGVEVNEFARLLLKFNLTLQSIVSKTRKRPQ
jgi:DNA-binding MarR family transcriptional regulator